MKKLYLGLCDLEKNINFWFVLFALFIFSLFRLPSLVEPDWYGDEGVYQVLGMAINQGRLLYRDIWDNKPPILYLIYSVFNGDLFSVRALSLIFGILSIISFYFLSKRLFESKFKIYFSTLIFAILFGLPILEGNIANAENFMLFPVILAGILIIDALRNNKVNRYIFAGLLLSFAFLIKVVAVFDFFAFLVMAFAVRFDQYLSVSYIKENYQNLFRLKKLLEELDNIIIFAVSFFVPIILASLFFLIRGAFADFIKATFSQNVGYVGYGNYFLFPMGMLMLKILILAAILLFILRIRKILGFPGLFIFIWLTFSLFNALFSERPYLHYLLVAVPSIALFFPFVIKSREFTIAKIAISSFLIFIVINNFNLQKTFYKNTVLYYENYLSFISENKTLGSYQEFFDKNTTRDYALANFIKTNTRDTDNIFLWSNSPQIYALSEKLPPGRYTVAYHITFYKNAVFETKNAVDSARPKYIIVTSSAPELVSFLSNYTLKYIIKGSYIYERKI